jgi:hypothetical protein
MRRNPMTVLRQILLADGITSALAGVALVVAPALIARLIGVPSAAVIAAVGAGLVVFGAGLVLNARRPAPRRDEIGFAVALNLAWVAGSVVVVTGGWLTTIGNWLVVLVADVVLIFAILEIVWLRKTSPPGAGNWGQSRVSQR